MKKKIFLSIVVVLCLFTVYGLTAMAVPPSPNYGEVSIPPSGPTGVYVQIRSSFNQYARGHAARGHMECIAPAETITISTSWGNSYTDATLRSKRGTFPYNPMTGASVQFTTYFNWVSHSAALQGYWPI